MRVLVLTTQKGGAGKTTLATSVAVAASHESEHVLALDTDPQGTLYAWGQRRGERPGLTVEACEPERLRNAIGAARKAGSYTLVVVDTPGAHGPVQALGIEPADYCLVPVKPSVFDVEAVKPTVRLLRSHGKSFGFVLSQVNVSSAARNLDAASALLASNPQSTPMIGSRNDFLDAGVQGLGVTEYAPKGKSAAEIKYLWSLTRAKLQEL
jgi:chromosome partitioning protein